MAWYQEWFGEKYLELYAHRDVAEAERQVDFFAARVGDERPRAILDLACGAGRHTDALRRRGFRAVGTDLSLILLAQARGLERVRGDMRRLPFASGAFDWVLNFFTSFGYFERERQNFEVLEEIQRVLIPGGRFLIDLFNRERVISRLVPSEVQERDGLRVEIERWFDPDSERVNKKIRLIDGGREQEFLESVRAYREEEVVIGLKWAGLQATAVYGDFDGEDFSSDSERLIVVGRRVD